MKLIISCSFKFWLSALLTVLLFFLFQREIYSMGLALPTVSHLARHVITTIAMSLASYHGSKQEQPPFPSFPQKPVQELKASPIPTLPQNPVRNKPISVQKQAIARSEHKIVHHSKPANKPGAISSSPPKVLVSPKVKVQESCPVEAKPSVSLATKPTTQKDYAKQAVIHAMTTPRFKTPSYNPPLIRKRGLSLPEGMYFKAYAVPVHYPSETEILAQDDYIISELSQKIPELKAHYEYAQEEAMCSLMASNFQGSNQGCGINTVIERLESRLALVEFSDALLLGTFGHLLKEAVEQSAYYYFDEQGNLRTPTSVPEASEYIAQFFKQFLPHKEFLAFLKENRGAVPKFREIYERELDSGVGDKIGRFFNAHFYKPEVDCCFYKQTHFTGWYSTLKYLVEKSLVNTWLKEIIQLYKQNNYKEIMRVVYCTKAPQGLSYHMRAFVRSLATHLHSIHHEENRLYEMEQAQKRSIENALKNQLIAACGAKQEKINQEQRDPEKIPSLCPERPPSKTLPCCGSQPRRSLPKGGPCMPSRPEEWQQCGSSLRKIDVGWWRCNFSKGVFTIPSVSDISSEEKISEKPEVDSTEAKEQGLEQQEEKEDDEQVIPAFSPEEEWYYHRAPKTAKELQEIIELLKERSIAEEVKRAIEDFFKEAYFNIEKLYEILKNTNDIRFEAVQNYKFTTMCFEHIFTLEAEGKVSNMNNVTRFKLKGFHSDFDNRLQEEGFIKFENIQNLGDGFYEAQLKCANTYKTSPSTFFPADWAPLDLAKKLVEAFNNPKKIEIEEDTHVLKITQPLTSKIEVLILVRQGGIIFNVFPQKINEKDYAKL
jgi:hypothetical protein